MADLNKVDDAALDPGTVAGPDPFAGASTQFPWPREVNVGQLLTEVADVLGETVRVAIAFPVGEDDSEVEISVRSPLTVYVTPSDADVEAVKAVLVAHRPDRYFGASDEERQLGQVIRKLQVGEGLTPEETQVALRGLLVA